MSQDTHVYENVIDAIIMNMPGYYFSIPSGMYTGFDIIKKIWIKIQKEKRTDTQDVSKQRAMWLSCARIIKTEDGLSLQTMDNGQWYHTGMILVKKEG